METSVSAHSRLDLPPAPLLHGRRLGHRGDSRFRREPKTGDLVGGQAQFTPFLAVLLRARGPNFGVATGVFANAG